MFTELWVAVARHNFKFVKIQIRELSRKTFFYDDLIVSFLFLSRQIPGFGEEGLAFFRDQAIKFPKLYTLWFGPGRPMLITCHPETNKVVLKSTLPKAVSGIGGYNFVRPWLGK